MSTHQKTQLNVSEFRSQAFRNSDRSRWISNTNGLIYRKFPSSRATVLSPTMLCWRTRPWSELQQLSLCREILRSEIWGQRFIAVFLYLEWLLSCSSLSRLAKSTLTLIPLLGIHEVVFAVLTEEPTDGVLNDVSLFFQLFLNSFQVQSGLNALKTFLDKIYFMVRH